MTANKLFLYIIISIMVLGIAHATATATATHTSIDKNTVNFYLTSNETVKTSFYLCTTSTCNGATANAISGNDTDFVYVFSTLTPDTKYYYKWNGTAEVTNAVYNSNIGSVTTDNYKVTGASRVIFQLFTFIVIAGIFLYGAIPTFQRRDYKTLIQLLAVGIVALIIINTWILAMLGL